MKVFRPILKLKISKAGASQLIITDFLIDKVIPEKIPKTDFEMFYQDQ